MVTLDAILGQAQGYSITNGWDVICAMGAVQINALLKQKFEREDRGGMAYKVDVTATMPGSTIKLNATLGPPELSFMLNEDSRANMEMAIQSGTLEFIYYDSKGKKHDDKQDLAGKNGKITAGVDIVKLKGEVKDKGHGKHDVVVDLATGTFDLGFGVKIDLPDIYAEALQNEIKIYFHKNLKNADYSLGTLIYDQNEILPALTPVTFDFKTAKSNDSEYGVLQIFINTEAGGTATKREISDLVTTSILPDEYSSVLIISSRVLFKDILLPQYQQKLDSGMKIISGDPDKDIAAFSLQGDTKISVDSYKHHNYGMKGFSIHMSNYLVQSVENNLYHDFNEDFSVRFWDITGPSSNPETNYDKVGVSLTMDEPEVNMAISADQKISFSTKNSIGVGLDGGGDLTINRKHMKEIIRPRIQKHVPSMAVQLEAVSVFAVSNLLFPDDNILDFSHVYVTGDMLVYGNVRSKL